MRGVFITGTDTGVGKTYIGVLLARALSAKGIRVVPRKPVESGCDVVDGELMPADAQALRRAAAYAGMLTDVCPYRFRPPLSPARAARLAGTELTTKELRKACTPDSDDSFMLVEGAGGFYSPLTADGLNADLAVALRLPVLLVARDVLGALNQVLLNVEAIRSRGLELVGIVLNGQSTQRQEHMDNATDLRERLDCAVFVQPHSTGDDAISETLVKAIIAGPPPANRASHPARVSR